MNIDELMKHESILLNRDTDLLQATESRGEFPYTFIIFKGTPYKVDDKREMHEIRWALWADGAASGGIIRSYYKEVNPWVKH